MDADTLEMLDTTLSQVLADDTGAAATVALRELGWDEVLADDLAASTEVLFSVQGKALGNSGALDMIIAHALGLDPWDTCVLLPVGVGDSPAPGADGSLSIDGYSTAGSAGSKLAASFERHGTLSVALVAADHPALTTTLIGGIDPELGLRRWTGTVDGDDVDWADDSDWEIGLAWGRIALAHELVGISRAMIAESVSHVTDRFQFGRPIGSFQAVKHHLAEAHVELAAATSTAQEAAHHPTVATARAAKALAGLAAQKAQKECQQVMGGIGFTWEHILHRYIRRALVLDTLLGSAVEIRSAIGATAIDDGRITMFGAIEPQ